MILVKPSELFSLAVPNHRELDRGILRALIRDSGLGVAEFIGLLRAF